MNSYLPSILNTSQNRALCDFGLPGRRPIAARPYWERHVTQVSHAPAKQTITPMDY